MGRCCSLFVYIVVLVLYYLLQIGHYLGDKMAFKGNEKQTDEFFMLLRHPLFCTNVLKVSRFKSELDPTLCVISI